MSKERKYWIAVACAAHVRRGVTDGFMQVCHGKGGPLKRIGPGDGVAYYSPMSIMGGHEPLRAFTAIGIVAEGEPYQIDMGNGFVPFRRDVRWMNASPAPIYPLLDALSFTAGRRNWGYSLRFGLVEIGAGDFGIICTAMRAGMLL